MNSTYDEKIVNGVVRKNNVLVRFLIKNEYFLFKYQNQETSFTRIPNELLMTDPLLLIKDNFKNITFDGISSLIDYCKLEKIKPLQTVLEWVYFYIKDENKQSELMNKSNETILGLNNLVEKYQLDKDDETIQTTVNGYKYFTSEKRNNLLKILQRTHYLNLDKNKKNIDYDILSEKFLSSVILLNFEDSLKYLREITNTKEKVPNEVRTVLPIIDEILNMYINNPNYTINNTNEDKLNNTFKKVLEQFQHINLPTYLKHSQILALLTERDLFFFEKLMYLVKFYNYDLKSYLAQLEHFYVSNGYIEGLVITGDSPASITLIENHLDKTDEILVVYILSKFFVNPNERIYKSIESEFFECLNKMKMFNERIHIDMKIRETLKILNNNQQQESMKKSDKRGAEFTLTCFFCLTSINQDKPDQRNPFIDFCPKCYKKMPLCAICLFPIEINAPNYNNEKKKHLNEKRLEVKSSSSRLFHETEEGGQEIKFIWCTKCRHGGHLEHIKEWFLELMVCPIPDCICICVENNHLIC